MKGCGKGCLALARENGIKPWSLKRFGIDRWLALSEDAKAVMRNQMNRSVGIRAEVIGRGQNVQRVPNDRV